MTVGSLDWNVMEAQLHSHTLVDTHTYCTHTHTRMDAYFRHMWTTIHTVEFTQMTRFHPTAVPNFKHIYSTDSRARHDLF